MSFLILFFLDWTDLPQTICHVMRLDGPGSTSRKRMQPMTADTSKDANIYVPSQQQTMFGLTDTPDML